MEKGELSYLQDQLLKSVLNTKLTILSGYHQANDCDLPLSIQTVIQNHKHYSKKFGYHYVFRKDCSKPASVSDQYNPFYLGCWSKPQFIMDYLESSDFVFWIDSDSIFTNFNRGLDDLIHINKSLIFTGDIYDACNSGHLLFRNDSISRKILREWDQTRFLNLIERRNEASGIELTHDGFVMGDQTGLNAILNSTIRNASDLCKAFNTINGYTGNSNRLYLDWQERFLPISQEKINNIKRNLIRSDLRESIEIVPQNRLNAYIDSVEGAPRYHFGDPIVHFVSHSKKYLNRMGIIERYLVERGIYISPFLSIYPLRFLKYLFQNLRNMLKEKLLSR